MGVEMARSRAVRGRMKESERSNGEMGREGPDFLNIRCTATMFSLS